MAQSLEDRGSAHGRVRLALYQPDIPQNTGTILRLAACLGIAVDIIGPTGFDMTDRSLRRAGLDYLEHVAITRHADWESFTAHPETRARRLVLLTARAEQPFTDHTFAARDTLLLGRESAGVPEAVHAAAGARILMTTHNLGQARRLAEDIVFIDRGRIVEQTAVAQFFNLPQTEAAQRFLQEETP